MSTSQILTLLLSVFALGGPLLAADVTRVADLAKDLARVSGKAVVIDRASARPVQLTPASAEDPLRQLKKAIESSGLMIAESEAIIRIVRPQEVAKAKKDLEEAASDPICKGSSLINTDFPEPTDIKDITRAYSLWLSQPLVMDRSVRGKVQIHQDKKIAKRTACQAWLAALNQIGLVVLHKNGIAVVLPMRQKPRWVWPSVTSNSFSGHTDFDFSEFSPLKEIVQKYNSITNAGIRLNDKLDGELSIVGANKIEKSKVPFLFHVAINKAGLKITDKSVVR